MTKRRRIRDWKESRERERMEGRKRERERQRMEGREREEGMVERWKGKEMSLV